MNDPHLLSSFRQALADLLGAECWAITAGAGTGSVILLHIGAKIPRAKEIKNPFLSEDARRFNGEFQLYVTAVWRLDSSEGVVCGAWDDNRQGAAMLDGLSQVTGRVIEGHDLGEAGLDLSLQFSGQFCLRIFCDQLNEVDQDDNYVFSSPRGEYIVGLRSVLRVSSI